MSCLMFDKHQYTWAGHTTEGNHADQFTQNVVLVQSIARNQNFKFVHMVTLSDSTGRKSVAPFETKLNTWN